MSTIARFKLPDVGEGLTDAEIISWEVAVGDCVEINQTLCEVETAKSAVELPSPVAGVVETLHAAVGDIVDVGTVIVSIRIGGPGGPGAAAPEPVGVAPDPEPATVADDVMAVDAAEEAPEPEPKVQILVGTGPSAPVERRRHLRPRGELPASPSRPAGGEVALVADTRVPIRGVRRATAAAMTESAFTAPHVTEWLAVDVTATTELVATLRADPRWVGLRINPMLLVAKALLMALEKYPEANARWDERAAEIVRFGSVNLGIAVASARGLVVPNIKRADALGLRGLAESVDRLVVTAREGILRPADMTGGTATITNIGALGVDAGTPILNPGEAVILAFGAIRPTPWVVDGRVEVRQVAQLALSFDHRLVDGELGSAVLTEVASVLRDPVAALIDHA
ncbi:2-oxo acid dehydrogenase subunit E2 [Gordonia amarae]|uniref:Dihydrolipoamide acetyltransferase component of pyruvate dehydrogenase complex n=2 Tax=Gordonia amarae TaxID=36821 RepID=G7GME4_9ACTN|nr:dihydrolipoamide acetyltransferase family protein [Gordonia amarae]MCS3880697.1 pyruvate dehydrogenase E2 component (dihydrolipoamide acetyltransferase) [Gordonia amarae]QHN18993.1 2-oxo acid dehydrogenase subunit E2 [Gordonia amarae]QHN23468.1 2-oxo acid dehydrogenase subunit E2 [Gordonia amarae]QHN32368.1 2-oxo acid dehydrogenase subunit E2 [Gordonia amarae]QHN41116.1 2-oxo acid dehydrogenase subunit E2 [Gordonia amarae]